jgi:hypothetical protein
LICDLKGRTETEGYRELGTEEVVLAWERENNTRLETLAQQEAACS